MSNDSTIVSEELKISNVHVIQMHIMENDDIMSSLDQLEKGTGETYINIDSQSPGIEKGGVVGAPLCFCPEITACFTAIFGATGIFKDAFFSR